MILGLLSPLHKREGSIMLRRRTISKRSVFARGTSEFHVFRRIRRRWLDTRDPIPSRQFLIKPVPAQRRRILRIELLIRALLLQDRPFGEISSEPRGGVERLELPGIEVSGELQSLAFVGLDGGVDGKGVEGVDLSGGGAADDPGGADDVVGDSGALVVGFEEIVLGVVEVWAKVLGRELAEDIIAIAQLIIALQLSTFGRGSDSFDGVLVLPMWMPLRRNVSSQYSRQRRWTANH